jgi:flagellar hook-associated protein 1 FlgK
MSVFDSLNIGYSGLSTSQEAINTTSHNISNANTPGYSKQRVNQTVNPPLDDRIPGSVGAGTRIKTITRVHDEYLYGRYKNSQSSLEFSNYQKQTLQEISDFFPDMDGDGIAQDLKDFFSSWSDISQDPDNDALKVVLVNNTNKLVSHLRDTNQKLKDVQTRINNEFKDGISKVNDLAYQIVEINKKINKIENVPEGNANDLRDQRDQLELEMNKLLNISVFKGNMQSYTKKVARTDMGNDYNININGYNIVDGTTFHPIDIDVNDRFFTASYKDHNSKKTDFTDKIRGGKLGAIVSLRGDGVDADGKPKNSKIQKYIDDLDSFAKGLIQKVNSLYAQSAKEKLQSDTYPFSNTTKLAEIDDINSGSFNVVVYNTQGEIVSKRAINIDETTTLDDGTNNSIVSQINADIDDNQDNDSTNDLDDLFEAKLVNHTLMIEQKDGIDGYYIAIEDNDTNFAGYSGFNKIFDGDSSKNIDIALNLKENPANLKAYKAPIDGNSDFANYMVKLQYETISFKRSNQEEVSQTIEGFYSFTVSNIATDATNATIDANATEALDKSINEQLKGTVGVDMDEELTNLMKYQTAYQASAKVITTIDQMLNTLLGIKQ